MEYLIYYSNNICVENIYYALSELLELSDRQWRTYELLDKDIREQLERYLKIIIDFEDEKIMDYILCIIPRIGLASLYEYILKNKDSISNKKIVANISESEMEYGSDVKNPYSKMNNFKE